jgi:hypothetical protein
MKTREPRAADQRVTGHVTEILSVWQPRSASPLVESDCYHIVSNLTGFFEVLLDWQAQEREEVALVKIEAESQ